MPHANTLAIVLIDAFADWEYPLLAAAARQWFGIDSRFFTPGGDPVTSMAGLRYTEGEPLDTMDLKKGDALAIIGSDTWTGAQAPDLTSKLQNFAEDEIVIGGICAGTLPMAKAGLFKDRKHTSNGTEWIAQNAGAYPGTQHYVDQHGAISDKNIITAPGSAPGTFAIEMLSALLPEKRDQIAEMKTMFAREYGGGPHP